MIRLVIVLAFIAAGHCSLPRNDRPQTGDDNALKQFLMKNNRLPYPNETVDGTPTTDVAQPNVGDWTTCEGCKLLVTELRQIMKNPQKVAELKVLLSRVCQMRILSHYQAECLNMVNNLITVLHEIEPLLDNPTLVCQELQYCASGVQGSLTPAKHLALLLGFKAMEVMYPGRTFDVACDECIFAVGEIKSLVQSASIQAELKQELHKICRMAGQYESECSALVDQYFDLLIQELVQLLNDGRQVCVDIGFCKTAAGQRSSVPMVQMTPAQRPGRVPLRRISAHSNVRMPQMEAFLFTVKRMQTRQGINAGCLVCEASFTAAIEALSQEQVATAVTTDLTNFVCALLPATMTTGCTDFMKIYSRAFLQMVISQYTPAQFCSAIHACKPEDQRKIEQLSPAEKSAAVCEACQVLSQYLSFEFQQPDFQQEVINTLKGGCSILPGDYKVQCEDSVVSYVPVTLGFFADYLSRNVVCATLKMCPGPQQATTAAPSA